MNYTQKQLDNWRTYERIRDSGLFNMFDPRARDMTTMSDSEWVFCISNYAALKAAANQGESAGGNEDRPSETFASARECAIDEQAQMMDDPYDD